MLQPLVKVQHSKKQTRCEWLPPNSKNRRDTCKQWFQASLKCQAFWWMQLCDPQTTRSIINAAPQTRLQHCINRWYYIRTAAWFHCEPFDKLNSTRLVYKQHHCVKGQKPISSHTHEQHLWWSAHYATHMGVTHAGLHSIEILSLLIKCAQWPPGLAIHCSQLDSVHPHKLQQMAIIIAGVLPNTILVQCSFSISPQMF